LRGAHSRPLREILGPLDGTGRHTHLSSDTLRPRGFGVEHLRLRHRRLRGQVLVALPLAGPVLSRSVVRRAPATTAATTPAFVVIPIHHLRAASQRWIVDRISG